MPRTKAPPRPREPVGTSIHANVSGTVHLSEDEDNEFENVSTNAKRARTKSNAVASFVSVMCGDVPSPASVPEHLLLCTVPVHWAVEEQPRPPAGTPQSDWMLLLPPFQIGQPPLSPVLLNTRTVKTKPDPGVKKSSSKASLQYCCSLAGATTSLDSKVAVSVGWLVSNGLAVLRLVGDSNLGGAGSSSSAPDSSMPTTLQVWLHKALLGVSSGLSVDQAKLNQSSSRLAHILRAPQCVTHQAAVVNHMQASGVQCTASVWTSKALVPTIFHAHGADKQVSGLTEQDMYAAAAPLPDERCSFDSATFSSSEEIALSQCLKPTLRQYQRRSLQWMLHRERGEAQDDAYLSLCTSVVDPVHGPVHLHPAWLQAVSQDGQTFYASPFYGFASIQPVQAPMPAHGLRGGIYADEMGLGKTVVTLGLVVCTDKERAALDAPSGQTSSPELVQQRILALVQGSASGTSGQDSLSPSDSDVACVCGATYSTRTPLIDPFRFAHMGQKQRASLVQGELADVLTWVQCSGCKRWQHALCGGLRESEAANAPFVCTECQACACGGTPLATHTSLVICPLPILKQWQAEIEKNAVVATASSSDSGTASSSSPSPGLRVEYYSGVKATLSALRECVSAANRLTLEIRATVDKLDNVQGAYSAGTWSAMHSSAQAAVHASLPGAGESSQAASTSADEAGVAVGTGNGAVSIGGQVYVFRDTGLASAQPASPGVIDLSDSAAEQLAKEESPVDCEEMSDDGFSLRTRKPKSSSHQDTSTRGVRAAAGSCGADVAPSMAHADVLLQRLYRAKWQLGQAESAAVKLAATLSPLHLAKADLVLSTYAALEADLHHADTVALPTLASAKVIADIAAAAARQSAASKEGLFRAKLQMLLRSEPGWQDLPAASSPPGKIASQSTGKRKRAVIEDSDDEGLTGTHSLSPSVAAPVSRQKNARQLSALGVAVDPLSGAIVRKDASFHGMFGLHGDLNVGSGGRKLRNGKKYRVVPSPLLGVHFHRIALDEAQMIDAPVTKCAQMANRLSGSFRWAVSGTPLARSIQDLHGLLLFIGIQPWCDKPLYYKGLLQPAEQGDRVARATLLRLAHDVMWRTHKADVQHELQLPPLTQETLTLHFSRIEEAYYRREFGRLLARIEPVLFAWRTEERKARNSRPADASPRAGRGAAWLLGEEPLTKKESEKLLAPLLRLRQACVHPAIGPQGIGKGKDRADADKKKGRSRGEVLSMATVLELMLARATSDAEDRLRDVVASHNGLAGLAWLADDFATTRTHYQAVLDLGAAGLRASTASSISIRVDPMQRIHALRNYASLIRAQPSVHQAAHSTSTAILHAGMLDRQAELLEEDVVRAAASVVQSEFGKLSREKLTQAMKLTHTAVCAQAVGEASTSSAAAQIRAASLANPRAGSAIAPSEVSQSVGALCISSTLLSDCLNVLVLEGMKAVRSWGPDQPQPIIDAVRFLHGQSESVASKDLKEMAGTSAMSVLWKADTIDAVLMLGMAALGELGKARAAALQQVVEWMQPSPADLAVTSNCRVCRDDWGKTGDTCKHCSARKSLLAYRSLLQTARQQTLDEEAVAKQGKKFSASGRLQRAKTKVVPGAQGDLRSLLTAEEEAAAIREEPEHDPLGPMDGSFVTPTALVRMLRAVAKACKGMQLDLGAVLGKGIAKATWSYREGEQKWVYSLQAVPSVEQGGFTVKYGPSSTGTGGSAVSSLSVVVDVGQWIDAAVGYMQDEQQALIDLHKVQADLLSSVDELAASLTRMALAPSGRPLSDAEALYVTTAAELPQRQKTLRLQLSAFEADLQKAKSQLVYLLSIQADEGRTLSESAAAPASAQGGPAPAAPLAACAICREPVGSSDGGKVSILATCVHRFCRVCLRALIRSSTSRDEIYGRVPLKCPECRVRFEEADILEATTEPGAAQNPTASKSPAKPRQPIAAGIVSPGGRASKLYESDTEEEHVGSDMHCLQHTINDPATLATAKADAQTLVTGSYGVKVETLVLCLKALRAKCSQHHTSSTAAAGVHGRAPKSIVFSQWDDALAIVQAACDKNGVKVYRVTSARHVSEVKASFAADPLADALLLPWNIGAEGLNVQEANHVFFLEPCLQPALEAQAIGRVWRMGQAQATYVHRLVIVGSIEETVLAMSRHKGRRLAAWTGSIGDAVRAGSGSASHVGQAGAHDILKHLDGLTERSLMAQSVEAGVRSSAGVAGRGDSAGITRQDVVRLFEAEEAFQRSLETQATTSNNVEATDRGREDDQAVSADEGDGDKGTADSARDSTIARQPLHAGVPSTHDYGRSAALNHSFWHERVCPVSRQGSGGGQQTLIRLAVLEQLQESHSNSTATGAPRIDVFGRSLSADLASAVLHLPRLLPPGSDRGTSRTTLSSLKAAPPTLQEQVSKRIEDLLADLAEL